MIKLKDLLKEGKETKEPVRQDDLASVTADVTKYFESNKKSFEKLADENDWDAFYEKAYDKFPDADQDDVAQALNKAMLSAGWVENETPEVTEKDLEDKAFGDKKNLGKGIKMGDYTKKSKAPKDVKPEISAPLDKMKFDKLKKKVTESSDCNCLHEEILEEAEYHGRKVTLNKPFLTPGGPRKRAVYVKNEKGNVVKVGFGDPNMRIKKNSPSHRKSFRARHHCEDPGPHWKARYWSCKAW